MSLMRRRNQQSNRFPAMPSPFGSLFDFENFFDRPWFSGGAMPAVNIKEDDANYEIELVAPGRTKEDFKISIAEGVLTISSETEENREEEKGAYRVKEFSRQSFSRSFYMPAGVDEDRTEASYAEGVLTVKLAKIVAAPEIQAKQIEIS